MAPRRTPLRVLMTADTVGGVWTYALEMTRALDRYGVEVVLATMGPLPSQRQVSAAAELSNLALCPREAALEWMPEPWDQVDAAGDWLLELERRVCPDVVHINGYAHAALPFRAPVVAVAHSCVCSWWRAVKGEDAPPSWDTYRRRVAAGLASADVVVGPTAAILTAVAHAYDSPQQGYVIYNGRRIAPMPRHSDPFILSAGRLWDEAKNLATLDACADDLPWPVYVAGPLRAGSEAVAPSTAVHPLGPLDPRTLTAWMSRAAIYCLPARYEPFGLSILEAAQAGCALVIGDIPSLREVWADAAVYVHPDNPDALHRALRVLIADPDRRAQMADRARRRATRYLPEPMATSYRTLYSELTRPRAAAGQFPPHQATAESRST